VSNRAVIAGALAGAIGGFGLAWFFVGNPYTALILTMAGWVVLLPTAMVGVREAQRKLRQEPPVK
jgi:hypothetical protein